MLRSHAIVRPHARLLSSLDNIHAIRKGQECLQAAQEAADDSARMLAWRRFEELDLPEEDSVAFDFLSRHPAIVHVQEERKPRVVFAKGKSDEETEAEIQEAYARYVSAQLNHWFLDENSVLLGAVPLTVNLESFREQLAKEMENVERAQDDFASRIENAKLLRMTSTLSLHDEFIVHWFPALTDTIRKYQRSLRFRKKGAAKNALAELLLQHDAEELAVITLNRMLSEVLYGWKTVTLAMTIGHSVELQANKNVLNKSHRFLATENMDKRTIKRVHQYLYEDVGWSKADQVLVGAALIKMAMDVCWVSSDGTPFCPEEGTKATEVHYPAFVHAMNNTHVKKQGFIRMVQTVVDSVDRTIEARLHGGAMFSSALPMLIRPLPWTCRVVNGGGGYLGHTTKLVRTRDSRLQKDLMVQALEKGEIEKVLQGLNVLSSTSWSINTRIYEVLREVMAMGGNIGDLVQGYDHPLPMEPSTDDEEERKQHRKEYNKTVQKNQDLHSLRSDLHLKLKIAEELKDREFYFPHNMDFRGRTYPVPPHLNHLGADFCRAMLQYSEKRPLGKEGLWWLKIHLANLHGADKLSFDDRIVFADEHVDDIMDSARDPLGGSRWWLHADDPWQCLATCFDLSAALQSENPEDYLSCLPIHQDGSCNGLQHYAALGGDVFGATQVNLVPSDLPGDVYSAVAELVTARVEKDAKDGDELAKQLVGTIKRKTVKQTVMTSVYGVTFIGARMQIEKTFDDNDDIPEEIYREASRYITVLTFEALDEMFTQAKKIMAWLADSASIVAKGGDAVQWTTPLGLPIIQPYRQKHKESVRTILQTITIETENDDLPVNTMRQKSAFPPNYVHSLDSTHMLMTAVACAQKGIVFASVHDSYWSHACDVSEMSRILREEFIHLHSQPLLRQLVEELRQNSPSVELTDPPEKGDLDLDVIRDSLYFFD